MFITPDGTEYRKLKQIGDGGFCDVFKVRRDRQLFAIKVLRDGYNREDLRRFQREVRMQSGLSHPHVVEIIDTNLDDTPPWFVMPLASYSLNSRLPALAGDIETIRAIFLQILDGIEYIHEVGNLVHRDLKPSNILFFDIDNGEVARVADLGLGRPLIRDTTVLTHGPGLVSYGYTPPEQYYDMASVERPGDIYSLGAILYAMYTGRAPIPSPDFSRLPTNLSHVVRKCMEHDPTRRYQTIEELRVEFLALTDPYDTRFGDLTIVIRDLVEALNENPGSIPLTKVKRVLTMLVKNPQKPFTEYLPKLSNTAIQYLLKHEGPLFMEVIRIFDGHVAGEQPFDLTDIVANFYRRLFQADSSMDIKQMILERLLDMGPRHNRWHVMRTLGDIIAGIKDRSLLLIAQEVLNRNPEQTMQCADYILRFNVAPMIRRTIEDLGRQDSA